MAGTGRLRKAVLSVALCLAGTGFGHSQVSKQTYIANTGASLDAIISRTNIQPQYPLLFSVNLFLAHEGMIRSSSLEVLTRAVDAFQEAGVRRVDINVGLWPWVGNRNFLSVTDAIAKYDGVISHIRRAGLQLVLNPQYTCLLLLGSCHSSFESWTAAAAPVYVELAQRYQPDVFVVVHEPTTMAARLGVNVSRAQWRAFVQDTARQIKAVAPRTRLGAGGLFTEEDHFRDFLTIEEIDTMTIDIYGIGFLESQLRDYDRMIALAQAAGKAVHIEETWRPPYPLLGAITGGIGDADFQALDGKWIRGMAQYAASKGLEAITPFWMQTFFLYVPSFIDALDPGYIQAVGDAILRGDRTQTFQAFQNEVQRLQARHVTLNSASFIGGPTAPESLVSLFAFEGTTLADATASATAIPLPPTLAGTTVLVTDQNGIERTASLLFVSPTQINFQIPSGTADGPARITVSRAGGSVEGSVQIAPVGPGLYAANANGQGVAAASVVRVRPDGSQTSQLVFRDDPENPGQRIPVPIDIGSESDEFILVLFGSGIRRNSGLANVRATVGGVNVVVDYAGDQQQFVGLDQVNLRLPRSLIGRGEVEVSLVVDGKFTNPVTVTIQ